MQAGIREILIITTPEDVGAFRRLLGSGGQWGIRLSYAIQVRPEGLAQAYVLGAEFVGNQPSALVLGDNIFFGHGLTETLSGVAQRAQGATVFGYRVTDPERYGVVEFDAGGKVVSLVEKPSRPKSRYAVTGLYFYDGDAPALAATIRPSARGELEITELNNRYLEAGKLVVELLGRGTAWLDTGTHESLLQASEFVRTIEERQGLKIGCPEEVAFENGWIAADQLSELGNRLSKSPYGQYLLSLVPSR
jgi:glucose-1-phosphate thymidylyltransferase